MNAERRKKLDKLIGEVEDIKSTVETLKNEEQEAYDNMPEGLQSGEKGELSEAALGAMGNAVTSLEDAISSIEEAKE